MNYIDHELTHSSPSSLSLLSSSSLPLPLFPFLFIPGPPGCGKTLIARQIGKVLNAREPKIINGPEVLDKFVGGSEEKIRALFADAEKEQLEMGDHSMLHIIIFDEMDAIMKTRGKCVVCVCVCVCLCVCVCAM